MYKSKNHSKYSLKVHLVFVVKYRKKLIMPEIDFFLKTKLNQIADRSDFEIELMETDKDHIHLLIDYDPKVSVLQIVRRLKQETAYELWKIHESYLRPHFWRERGPFGVMDILLVQLEKVQAMRQSKSTLEIRDSRHSWSQLKTDTFSGKRGINMELIISQSLVLFKIKLDVLERKI